MNELITINSAEFGGELQQTVNARDLYEFLRVGRDFSTWIKDRIEQYKFLENQDFGVFPEFGENPKGGRPSLRYELTLDMAKELSMIENNEQGRQVRRYFIACEKRAKELTDSQNRTVLPFKISTDNPNLETSLNALQVGLVAINKSPEVIAGLLHQVLRENGVTNVSSQMIITATCAEDVIDYGHGCLATIKRAKAVSKKHLKATRKAEAIQEAIDISDPRMIAAIDLTDRPNAWMTSTEIMRVSGYKYRQNDLSEDCRLLGRYLSSLSLEKKRSNRGTLYSVHLRAHAGQLPGSRGADRIKRLAS